jgi:hypothetical protein
MPLNLEQDTGRILLCGDSLPVWNTRLIHVDALCSKPDFNVLCREDAMQGSTVLILLVGVVLAGCQSLVGPESYSLGPPFQTPAVAEPGRAQAVFYFPEPVKADLAFLVYEDENTIGVLRGGSYFTQSVEPGRHRFLMDLGYQNKWDHEVTFTAQPGRTYYFRFIRFKSFQWPTFTLVTEEIALAELPGLTRIDWHKGTPKPDTSLTYRDARS